MSFRHLTGRAQLKKAYKLLEEMPLSSAILYYENNKRSLKYIDPVSQLKFYTWYIGALAASGQHIKLLKETDELIPQLLCTEVFPEFHSEEYQWVLFKKAVSLFELSRITESIGIIKQPIKLNPTYMPFRYLLYRCLISQRGVALRSIRTVFISFILVASLIIAAELLSLPVIWPELINPAELGRNIIFCMGALLLGISELMHVGKSLWKVYFLK